MSRLVWDKAGEHRYETGVDRGVLFVYDKTKKAYGAGVAWSGLTTVTESPSGAEASAFYADNIKYLSLLSAEEYGATIEAYTYPEEFEVCNGAAELAKGVTIGQQPRATFAFAYRTLIGNDQEGNEAGYKLHIVYGCMASPSEKSHATVNDSLEPTSFSWTITTTPIAVPGHKPTATFEFDSTKTDTEKLKQVEDALYGTDATSGETSSTGTDSKLLMPEDLIKIFPAA